MAKYILVVITILLMIIIVMLDNLNNGMIYKTLSYCWQGLTESTQQQHELTSKPEQHELTSKPVKRNPIKKPNLHCQHIGFTQDENPNNLCVTSSTYARGVICVEDDYFITIAYCSKNK